MKKILTALVLTVAFLGGVSTAMAFQTPDPPSAKMIVNTPKCIPGSSFAWNMDKFHTYGSCVTYGGNGSPVKGSNAPKKP